LKKDDEGDSDVDSGGQFHGWEIDGTYKDESGCQNAIQRQRAEGFFIGQETNCVTLDDPRWQPIHVQTWLLLEPPSFGGDTAPLAEWTSQNDEFPSYSACQAKSTTLPGTKCIASDDPRLKNR
jgi:hypothetical protein